MGRAPGRVGDILKSSFGRLGVSKRLNEYTILKVWDDVVGEEIAQRARPLRLIKGKLYVNVSSSPWMSELMHLKESMRGRINERLGSNTVEDIVFRVGQVKREIKVVKKKEVVKQLSPREIKTIYDTVSVVEDSDLSRLLAHVMEKQKACSD
jgi:predicted nucleic acid-binding Zn ribbon protein